MTPADLEFVPFDADNHYYEATDAFTRHVPENMQHRVVQWVDIGGRRHHLVGGKLSRAVANSTWDPIAKPGALRPYFEGNPDRLNPLDMLKDREPLPVHYQGPAARVKIIAEQGLQGVWLFPTLGVLYEELIKHDTEAAVVLMQAFNQWIYDDWKYNYENKIFSAPYISLAAMAERLGPKSTRCSGYSSQGYADDSFTSFGRGRGGGFGPDLGGFAIERAAKKSYWWFNDHPIDTFKQHVWMNPFWEDDVNEVVDLMGAERVIFGSDWPHIEGMALPLDHLVELKDFDEAQRRAIMLDNVTFLNTAQPL